VRLSRALSVLKSASEAPVQIEPAPAVKAESVGSGKEKTVPAKAKAPKTAKKAAPAKAETKEKPKAKPKAKKE
jgi:hypothetical protein